MAYSYLGYKWNGGALGTAGGNVTWSIGSSVPANLQDDLLAAFRWSDYGDVDFTKASSNANIVFQYGNIDGQGRIAGQAEVSHSGASITSVVITIDSSENWQQGADGVAFAPGSNVRFGTVALHEVGHAIGIDHYNAEPAIMNATLSSGINDLQASDIDAVRSIYGAPAGGGGGATAGADDLTGTGAANTISLLTGNDTYHGLGARDLVFGNEGNDKLYGDDGGDRLYGGKDRDLLDGGAGRDVLDGGLGSDTLIGGADADRFVLNRDPGSRDVIKDFHVAEGDRLDLRGQAYTARFSSAGDTFLDLSGGGAVQLVGVSEAAFAAGGFVVG